MSSIVCRLTVPIHCERVQGVNCTDEGHQGRYSDTYTCFMPADTGYKCDGSALPNSFGQDTAPLLSSDHLTPDVTISSHLPLGVLRSRMSLGATVSSTTMNTGKYEAWVLRVIL